MKNRYLKVGLIVGLFATAFLYVGCGGNDNSECPDLSVEDLVETDVIEEYHRVLTNSVQGQNDPNQGGLDVYIDFSTGVTRYCLQDPNSKTVFKSFLDIIDQHDPKLYELSAGTVNPYNADDWFNHFYMVDANSDFGEARMDSALDEIVSSDNVSVLVTDGELYVKGKGGFQLEPWAIGPLADWFKKGGVLNVISTDFTEHHNGDNYEKHMYFLVFIPNSLTEGDIALSLTDKLVEKIKADGGVHNQVLFSTSTNGIFERKYKNDFTPGTDKYIEEYLKVDAFLASDNLPVEFIDFSETSDFTLDDSGFIFSHRNQSGDPFPFIHHLFLDLESVLSSYENIKIKAVVHDVAKDFSNWKRNYLAKNHTPTIFQTKDGDSLRDDNTLAFDCVQLIDGEAPYDTARKNKPDIADNFEKLLTKDFRYKAGSFNSSDKGVLDFIVLDQKAGENNTENEEKFEVVLKFSDQLTEAHPDLNREENNYFRIDIVIEDLELKPDAVERDMFTWKRIPIPGQSAVPPLDATLYDALQSVLDRDDVKPKGAVLYSYYIKLGPFNP